LLLDAGFDNPEKRCTGRRRAMRIRRRQIYLLTWVTQLYSL